MAKTGGQREAKQGQKSGFNKFFLGLYVFLVLVCVLIMFFGSKVTKFDEEVGYACDGIGAIDGFSYVLYFSPVNLVVLALIYLLAVVLTILPQNHLKNKAIWLAVVLFVSLSVVPIGKVHTSGGLAGISRDQGLNTLSYFRSAWLGDWKASSNACMPRPRLPEPDVIYSDEL